MPRLPFATVLLACAAFYATPLLAKTAPATPSAGNTDLTIVLVSPDFYIRENFTDVATFAEGIKPALELCKQASVSADRPQKLLVQLTLHKASEPTFELAGIPALKKPFANALQSKLTALSLPHPAFCDVTVRFQTLEKGEEPFAAATSFKPRVPLPANAAVDRFIASDLAHQAKLLRAWARDEALPLLAHQASGVDSKFAGVRHTGQKLAALDLSQPLTVEQLTYDDPEFWRGVMEMSEGNQLVAVQPLFLFVANGEFAKAGHLYSVLRGNARPGSSAAAMLERFGAMFGPFLRQHSERIQAGIELHDKGRYADAVRVYEGVLADVPTSAWARYELFFSTIHRDKLFPPKNPGQFEQLWDAAAVEIYRLDPLYDVQMTGNRGKNLGSMIDRLTLRSMEEKAPEDELQAYANRAEVALHLSRYGEAAIFYWQLLFRKGEAHVQLITDKTPRPLTTEQVITRYFYCLEQLGAPEWKKQFKGDFPAAFNQLDAELIAHRTQ